MMHFRGRGLWKTTRLVTGCAVIAGGLLLTGSGASATYGRPSKSTSSGPVVTATPNTGLVNGKAVTASVTNAIPPAAQGDPVVFVECNLKVISDPSAAHCTNPLASGFVDSSGNVGPLKMHVVSGAVGDGFCGTDTLSRMCILGAADVVNSASPIPLGGTQLFFRVPVVRTSQSVLVAAGETVNLNGNSFPASESVTIMECDSAFISSLGSGLPTNACDTANAVPTSTDGSGVISQTPFLVLTDSAYSDTNGGHCGLGDTCYIVVFGGGDFDMAAFTAA